MKFILGERGELTRVVLSGLIIVLVHSICFGKDSPAVGAIRWDAWTGGQITQQVEKTLAPKKYQDRLPWFTEILENGEVKINGGRQEVMDREIEFAANAGLDYWAFLIYQKNYSMTTALEQYLKSERRSEINFCMILSNTLKANEAQWPKERDRAISLLKEPGYQTVLNDRPLVYLFAGSNFRFDRFSEFLTVAKEDGLDPYCVYMGWNPAVDYKQVKGRGFDAVSAYAKSGKQASFAELVKTVEKNDWQSAAKSKASYVPLVTTGWDKNPRIDNPVSWELGHGYHQQKVFPSKAKPVEIAQHLDNALSFVDHHRDICKAQSIILYAWNEYDEGGWLAPTLRSDGQADTSRLDAIREVLKKTK